MTIKFGAFVTAPTQGKTFGCEKILKKHKKYLLYELIYDEVITTEVRRIP